MQSIANILQDSNPNKSCKTAQIWPVWKDSIRNAVSFSPMGKKQVAKLWFSARKWDQRTHEKGKHAGIVGRSALAVLYTLLTDFLNHASGRLDPSIKAIARNASVSERTAARALQKLRTLGIIDWQRRSETAYDSAGRFILRQRTNAYAVLTKTRWRGFIDDEPPPPPPDLLGAPPRFPDAIDAAAAEIVAGNRSGTYSALMSDQTDRLSVALAQLGRAMGTI